MSALIIVREQNSSSVHVLTDLGVFDAHGKLIGAAAKISHLPHLRGVVALRGHLPQLPLAELMLSCCATSFNELKYRAPEVAEQILKTSRQSNHAHWAYDDFEIAIAGIDEQGSPDSFLICSHDRHGHPPFARIDLGELALLPGGDEILTEIHASPVERNVDGSLDIVSFGRRVIEIQRRNPLPDPTGNSLRQIGVGVLLTTVESDCISSRVIRRWPDEIGDVICLHRGAGESEKVRWPAQPS